ncbi:MAG: NAD(P)-dependent oxidoreductase [Sarcina sp.]
MFENFKNDFLLENEHSNLGYLAIDYKNIRVGVIGAGKVALLKLNKFINKGSYIEIIAKEFSEDFLNMNCENIKLFNEKYAKKFIKDKHLIIIAIDDKILTNEIVKDCKDEFKLFINCVDSNNSLARMPYQRESDKFLFALNSKDTNPKNVKLVGKKILNMINEEDEFEDFTYKLRLKVNDKYYREDILNFINTEDFKFFWKKEKSEIVLKLFF